MLDFVNRGPNNRFGGVHFVKPKRSGREILGFQNRRKVRILLSGNVQSGNIPSGIKNKTLINSEVVSNGQTSIILSLTYHFQDL